MSPIYLIYQKLCLLSDFFIFLSPIQIIIILDPMKFFLNLFSFPIILELFILLFVFIFTSIFIFASVFKFIIAAIFFIFIIEFSFALFQSSKICPRAPLLRFSISLYKFHSMSICLD